MSDIQLSSELFAEIQNAVKKADPTADQGVVMQYLAAVMGYLLAKQSNYNPKQQEEFLNELCGFVHHVWQDVLQQSAPQSPAQDAFGIWEPK